MFQVERINNWNYQVDLSTGEIVDYVMPAYLARDLEELNELCKTKKGYGVSYSAKVSDLIRLNLIDPYVYKNFLDLTPHIVTNNIAVVTTDTLVEVLGVNRGNLSRKLLSLQESGIVYVFSPLGRKGDVRNVVFHPALVWKGDYAYRNRLEEKILETNDYWWRIKL
ncbi:hypothetical protein NVP1170O_089 [Vibrio phage 1.170.O._10N.261.52.C3]|nr:hypothetical protein NVP1170O_089 [Vibrio phage 1.170.O._10N.261.52.C3]